MEELIKNGVILQQVIWAVIAILIGVLITLFANYKSTKVNEQLKLKAKLAEKRMDVVEQLLSLSVMLHTVQAFPDKALGDLGFEFSLSETENNPLRGPILLLSDEVYDNFRLTFIELFHGKGYMLNDTINKLGAYCQDYFINLDLLKANIPLDERWKLAVVLKPDFQSLSQSLSTALQKYLNTDIYSFGRKTIRWKKYKMEQSKNKIASTNLVKYHEQLYALSVFDEV